MGWLDLAGRLLPAGGWGAFLLLVGILLRLVLTDRLVSGRRLREERTAFAAQLETERKIAERHEARADELLSQNGKLIDQGRTLQSTLQALPRAGGARR